MAGNESEIIRPRAVLEGAQLEVIRQGCTQADRSGAGFAAGFDRIDTAGQLPKQILGAVAGVLQGEGREVPDLDTAALAAYPLHHTVGLMAGWIDAQRQAGLSGIADLVPVGSGFQRLQALHGKAQRSIAIQNGSLLGRYTAAIFSNT